MYIIRGYKSDAPGDINYVAIDIVPYWTSSLSEACRFEDLEEAKEVTDSGAFTRYSKYSNGIVYPPRMISSLYGQGETIIEICEVSLTTVETVTYPNQ